MFFELSKLLNFFLFPVTWIVALLIGSMALRKYPWVRKLCLWGSAVLFLVFTNGPLFDLAKSSMIEEYRFPHWEEGKIYRVCHRHGRFCRNEQGTRHPSVRTKPGRSPLGSRTIVPNRKSEPHSNYRRSLFKPET